MTREDIECIIKWFSHIEQLATDGKTANGFQMPLDKILATIKVVAKDSREYVEKFCDESTQNDLEEAADNYIGEVVDAAGHPGWEWETRDVKDALIAGYNLCREQMMKEAVEGTVTESYGFEKNENGEWVQVISPIIRINVEKYSLGDKVRVIVCKKED